MHKFQESLNVWKGRRDDRRINRKIGKRMGAKTDRRMGKP